jgi:hypothetical protein
MSSPQKRPPAFLSIAPRFVVHDMEQALAFYRQLGFQTTYGDEHFAVLERDGVNLHLNCYADAPKRHAVCWIGVTNVDALYQHYAPTNAVCSPLKTQPWGFREFMVRDPFGNGILFAEHIPEEEPRSEQGG